jgi:hypothetical protein
MTTVGTLHVPAREGFLETFEYAGAGAVWNLDEADIPVVRSKDGYWFIVRRPGTRIDSWFQNRIGASYGSNNRDTTPKVGTVSMQFDKYTAGKYVAEGVLTLSEGWVNVKVGEYSDGRPMYRVEQVAK